MEANGKTKDYISSMTSISDLTFTDTTGKDILLGEYSGKLLLLVNTATQCGLAGQFKELETLHQDYKERGLVVIGFPCDQFADQEPETDETMVGVCQLNFGVTFPLSKKIDVNGEDTDPIFDFLKSRSKSLLGKDIKWNFTKFLVGVDGETVRRYSPTTSPLSLRNDIEERLAALAN